MFCSDVQIYCAVVGKVPQKLVIELLMQLRVVLKYKEVLAVFKTVKQNISAQAVRNLTAWNKGHPPPCSAFPLPPLLCHLYYAWHVCLISFAFFRALRGNSIFSDENVDFSA